MDEKIPPQDIDAEQCVLGSMLMSKSAISAAIQRLTPEYFYKPAHITVFSAVVNIFKKNEPIDLITLSDELKRMKTLEECGGRAYLAEILDSVPTAANIESYVDIVLEKALLRRLIDAGSKIVNDSFNATNEVGTVLDDAQRQIMDITKSTISERFVKLGEVINDVFDNIQATYQNEDKILGVPSGFPDFDAMTSGFQKSDLIILAARPAMGKTTLALNFATNAAIQKKVPVAIFSLEMPKEQLALRLLCSEAKVDSKRLRTANLLDHEYRDLNQAMGKLYEAPIYIDDSPGLTPLELRAKFRRLQLETDVQLIMIDYLQLMRSGNRSREGRFQEISEIVREVKGFAKEANVPIIALSQLSRDVEKRQDKIPQLSDLRESGELEQTADIVAFIHRDSYYEQQTEDEKFSQTKLIIAKQRNGPTGAVDLVFRKDISKFMSSIPQHQDIATS